jgi:hypothetical protein
MESFPINWWAVIVAALVKFVLGWAWYSPPVMGKQWQALVGQTDAEVRAGLPRAIPIDIIASLVMAFILLHAVHYAGATTLLQGAAVGFLNWLGFIATVQIGQVVYEKKPWRLFVINNVYLVVALIVMGAILALWDYGAPAAAPAA